MQTNEMYFLILVCGAFGALIITLAVGTIHDRKWMRRQAEQLAGTRR